MFVAVVYKYYGEDNDYVSHRPEGEWSCFLGKTKEEAAEKATFAAIRWTGRGEFGQKHGPYKILVGALNELAELPLKYSEFKGEPWELS